MKLLQKVLQSAVESGAPGVVRTPDLLVRSQIQGNTQQPKVAYIGCVAGSSAILGNHERLKSTAKTTALTQGAVSKIERIQ